mgnify:CR=1 FL=1
MKWESILKIDAGELIDDIAKLKDIVAEMEETIRLYNDGEMLDEASIRLDLQEFKLLVENIQKNMILIYTKTRGSWYVGKDSKGKWYYASTH